MCKNCKTVELPVPEEDENQIDSTTQSTAEKAVKDL